MVELAKLGAYKEALEICRKIKKNHSNDASYYNITGILARRLGLLDEAFLNSKRAIQIDESLVAAKMNIANIELQKGNIYKAIALFEDILTEQPSYHEAGANLAVAYKSVGKLRKALNIYKNLDFRDPWSNKAKFNYGITLITNKNFENGWKYYEYRWKTSPHNKVVWPLPDKPLWRGERGSTLLCGESRALETKLYFSAWFPKLRRCVVVYRYMLIHVYKTYVSVRCQEIDFVKDLEDLEDIECEHHLPLGSVPGLIRNDISDFDRTVKGYLKADPQRVKSIRTN